MESITEMALSKIDPIYQVNDAKYGSILQFCLSNQLHVGMKTSYMTANGKLDVVLLLSGQDCGSLVEQVLIQTTCLVLDNVVELVAINPGLLPASGLRNIPKGSLYKSNVLDRVFYMWGKLAGPDNIPGQWVCVASDNAQAAVGSQQANLNLSNLTPISARTEVRLTDQAVLP